MRNFHIKLTAEQIKYLSQAFNNELTIQQPNLFKNVHLVKQVRPSEFHVVQAVVLANCAKSLIKGIATQLLNKSNLTVQNSRKGASVCITEAEAYALILCAKFNGFEHFGQYEKGVLYLIQDKANQLAISD